MNWDVDPIIVQVGRFALSWYGLLFAGGFYAGFQVMHWIYRREGRNPAELDRLLWFVLLGTVIGMRLVHCLIYDPRYFLSHPWEIPQVWRGGYASHGGAAGLLIGVWWYCRTQGRPSFLWLLDRLAIAAVLAGAFIRVGNFFNSEILGKPTTSIFGVVFEHVDKVDPIPRHPTQLYEAAAYFLIFAVLLTMYRRRLALRDGIVVGWYFVLVFAARFVLEFTKDPQATYEAGFVISVGQFLSVPFVLAGIVLLLRARRARSATSLDSEKLSANQKP